MHVKEQCTLTGKGGFEGEDEGASSWASKPSKLPSFRGFEGASDPSVRKGLRSPLRC